MIDPSHAHHHPVMDDLLEASRRLDQAERARARALRAWETSDEPYPLNAAIALEAAERDLRLARQHLEAVQKALVPQTIAPIVGAPPSVPTVPSAVVATAPLVADDADEDEADAPPARSRAWAAEKSWGSH